MTDNVTPISLDNASQARLLSDQHVAEGDEKLETFVSVELFSDKAPQITHNKASVERLLFVSKILEQYALGHVGSEPV
jgi:hypothetical protein